MKESRLPSGISDPLAFTCICPPSSPPKGGLVLLFYRYFASPPALPSTYDGFASSPSDLAAFHRGLTQELQLGGKLRISREGFNITVGGTRESINRYIQTLMTHWSFTDLDLTTPGKQKAFFKPTKGGCACVFGGVPASVLVKEEITPMGVTNYVPKDWNAIESLSPEEFHRRCCEDRQDGVERVLLDVRNHYESRIGYFVESAGGSGTTRAAIRPGIRRFSQWPGFVKRYLKQEDGDEYRDVGGRQIMTYCTGGIRCEKGARWMQENMAKRVGDTVCTLKGGIAAYLMWIEEEISAGRRRADDSLFKGRNFVFDARGSTGLSKTPELVPVSDCHVCGTPSDRLGKCKSDRCHLILVICEACDVYKDPRCCQSCRDGDPELGRNQEQVEKGRKWICSCEQEREADLWGREQVKLSAGRKSRDTCNRLLTGQKISIEVKTFE